MAQLSLKKTIARLLRWTEYPTVKRSTANTDSFFTAQSTDTGTTVSFGIGSGGVNHGVYSNKLGKWLIHGDDSLVYVNGVQMRRTSVSATKSGSVWTAGTITVYYNCGTVTVLFSNVSFGTVTSRTTFATIPTGFRPAGEAYGKANNPSYTGTLIVQASGNLQIDSAFSGKTGVYATITYAQWA